jgi:hypothetical protein
MDEIVKECEELMKKYGHLPFDKALPHLQEGWWRIGSKYGISGTEVFKRYMDWKAKQK